MKSLTLPKNKSKKIISISIGSEKVVWLQEINKYILVNPPTDQIIEQLFQGKSEKSIQRFWVDKLGLTAQEALKIVAEVKNNLRELYNKSNSQDSSLTNSPIKKTACNFKCKRFYDIMGVVFFVEYQYPEIESLIHPKFAHLEISEKSEFAYHFQVFISESNYVLVVNNKIIGVWNMEKQHFMAGKFSMEMLQKIYKKEEDQWMAVFHATGISNGKECLMFLGDSGSGKSTLSAILMSIGFDVLADDFLPVESKTAQLCVFPAAISVKKSAIDLLITQFPELKRTKEYSYPAFNKTVRYLSNSYSATGIPKKAPCKALVFVEFKANSGLQFSKLPKYIAFQKLVPDSWISPLETNARCFLDWFDRLPCYQLTYSDNEAMVRTVKNLFEDEI